MASVGVGLHCYKQQRTDSTAEVRAIEGAETQTRSRRRENDLCKAEGTRKATGPVFSQGVGVLKPLKDFPPLLEGQSV